MMNATELQQRLQFARDAARRAGEFILEYYQAQDLQVEQKRDRSPVTAADRGAEELLRAAIQSEFPADGILGEEFGETPSQNGYRWILDPVDGTKSFVHGVPLFGTLIGLEHEQECVLGVCRFPALDEVIYAAQGGGTWWQRGEREPEPAHVSSIDKLADALFCVTTITGWAKGGHAAKFERLCRESGLTRGWGDCYGHILVATGRAELMVDPVMNAWDAAALVPILSEAGGEYLDWNGNRSIYSGNGVSVNSALKETVLDILRHV